ncbi:hypothetical protein PACTADRAFT_49963 [Pachysolen tannophilus NRRL Y-2460]|uniref:rRNA-processing protein FYV7 n=1 Tax=Pachysolen tannophilus NRRL Y-2460 TaxID=669874 RepID=A0A1E4TTY9_PACTA|nr:hypothetical protein PACTADRAFT_49963 [Pachysolen tannophilus NRRL Y-2460]
MVDRKRMDNPYKDRRDLKNREIKKSLTHRARLRKNYFKLLEKEGESVPSRDGNSDDQDQNQNQKEEEKEEQEQEQEQGDRNTKLTYQDRLKISKQRKLVKQQRILEARKEKIAKIEKAKNQRERNKEKFKQKTSKGQPLMGPRISNLLDKIRTNAD